MVKSVQRENKPMTIEECYADHIERTLNCSLPFSKLNHCIQTRMTYLFFIHIVKLTCLNINFSSLHKSEHMKEENQPELEWPLCESNDQFNDFKSLTFKLHSMDIANVSK